MAFANRYNYAHHCLTGDNLVHAPDGTSYVAHSWISFRPFAKELLESVAKVKQQKLAAWAEDIIKCLNPAAPHVGFGESATYMTHVVKNHREALDIQKRQTWVRNIEKHYVAGKYCCPTEHSLDIYAKKELEFIGFELGHTPNRDCGYADDPFFRTNPYPPKDDTFWTSRGLTFPR